MAIVESKKNDKETKTGKEKTKSQVFGKAGFAFRFLMEPWITEKSHQEMEQNKYVFKVRKDSTKDNIKKAIEDFYKVTILDVHTVTIHPKKRIYGRTKGKKSGFKKAIVTLKEGDKIELFAGV